MKLVFLDRKSIGDDLDLSMFSALGEIELYDFSSPEEVPMRVSDADAIIVNKVPVNEETIGKAKKLKLVCVTATGTNNLDKAYLDKRGIAWRNVAGYSTESVAQHTFALLFYLWEHLPYYDKYVKSGKYEGDRLFTHFGIAFHELSGMRWGIVGLGAIGRRVAELAECFCCKVMYYSTSGRNHDSHFKEVSLDELLRESDIVSVHAPLGERTFHLFDRDSFQKMKRSAIFLNVGRGDIVDEAALRDALNEGEISAAGLDVLSVEPMSAENPLKDVKEKDRLFITPHIAWASLEARERLMRTIYRQIYEFFTTDGA